MNAGPGFNSVVDVLAMKQYTWPKDGGKATAADIDGAHADKAEEYRMALLEMAAENDEELMMKFLDEMTLTDEETIKGIRLGMVDRSIFPVVLISAENNIGTDRMLDIMSIIVPDVTEMPAPKNANGDEVPFDESAPVSVFFFKTSVESNIGEVSYFKVMSGTLKAGADLTNMNRGRLRSTWFVARTRPRSTSSTLVTSVLL